jgi:hypothetical protein
MTKINKDNQKQLIDQLSNLGFGQSEVEHKESFGSNFFPIKEHLRALDPDVVLVVGDRGTGKSGLFQAVFEKQLLLKLERFSPQLRLPVEKIGQTKWLSGYPSGRQFPDPRGLSQVLSGPNAELFWFAYLVRLLQNEINDISLRELSNNPGGDPIKILEVFKNLGNRPLLALDKLDQTLENHNSWIFIGYDELDILGGSDWAAMISAVQRLIEFWSGYSRRWQRIRAKIFLRSDLFRRHANLGGADLAKLAANRVELRWNNQNLYAMLIKRIANKSEQLFDYCKGAKVPFEKEKNDTFGHIPIFQDAENARPFIERLIGPYMGSNKNKGHSFSWILDHLRDGSNVVTPRRLVRLIEKTATKEHDRLKARTPHLFNPVSIRQALDDVSTDHIKDALTEWPWLLGVKTRLENGLVPWTKNELYRLLERDWENSWSISAQQKIRPPADSARELVEYMIDLGILRERTESRIDVPDIYLKGLNLRRKGGVKKT